MRSFAALRYSVILRLIFRMVIVRCDLATELRWLEGGTITSPKGFKAGATYSGIRTYSEGKLDLGMARSDNECTVAGSFTTSKVRSSSVTLDQNRVLSGRAQAIVVNSGIANACVGDQGMKDAIDMAEAAAISLDLDPDLVLPASTGLIGVELPMALIRNGVKNIAMTYEGGHDLARAILTTDKRSKEVAVSFQVEDKTYVLGGIAKGSGMIHPNMATMLGFLATDAGVDSGFLQDALTYAVNRSFNMITVDGDTSTNDTVIILANGAAGGEQISNGTAGSESFREALLQVCVYLAKEIARDGEGATKLIQVDVEGAKNENDARIAAKAVASSTLVKSAVHGGDPNWGRIIAALGYSGAELDEDLIDLYINEVKIMEDGKPIPFFKESVEVAMSGESVAIRLDLKLESGAATAWGCDLSEEYVTFNSAYTT